LSVKLILTKETRRFKSGRKFLSLASLRAFASWCEIGLKQSVGSKKKREEAELLPAIKFDK